MKTRLLLVGAALAPLAGCAPDATRPVAAPPVGAPVPSPPSSNEAPVAIFGTDAEGLGLSGGGIGLGNVKGAPLGSGPATTSGRLPAEVIQRIVRQNFARLRACYESGLTQNPDLRGKVSVRFVIETDGHVSSAAPVDPPRTGITDSKVVACVVAGFSKLEFPAPDGGKVTVVYPIIFAPGD